MTLAALAEMLTRVSGLMDPDEEVLLVRKIATQIRPQLLGIEPGLERNLEAVRQILAGTEELRLLDG